MARSTGDSLRRSFWLTLALLAMFSCTGGGGCGGCGGCGGGTYRYPQDDPNRPDAVLQNDAATARITQAFIDFIQPLLPGLIKSALANGSMVVDGQNRLHIPIPDQNDLIDVSVAGVGLVGVDLRQAEALVYLDDLSVCQGTNRRRCMLLELVETPADQMGVRLSLYETRLGLRANVEAELVGSDATCGVFGSAAAGNVAAEFSVHTLIQPGVGPNPDRNLDVGVQVNEVQLVDLAVDVVDSNTYCQQSKCQDCAVEIAGTCLDPGGRCNECYLLCGGVLNGVAGLASALSDLVRPLVNRVLTPIISNFVRSALADFNGQPAKLEQQVSIADLVGLAALSGANPFGLFAAPAVGKFPVVTRAGQKGMDITLTGGAEAELADCIPALEPFFASHGPVPVLSGLDDRGRPYHFGFTMAASMLNQVLYAVHRSGSLCVKLSSQDVKELTGGGFSLNASVLSLLAADISKIAEEAAPVIVQLKPREPGLITLGSGTRTGTDAAGNPTYDWLLNLALREMGVAFHVLVHDRYVRVFEVTADLGVGLNVNVLPDNRIEAAIGQIKIENFEQVFNEILPNSDFAELLPTLLDLAMQALLKNQLSFDFDLTDALSSALGGAPIYMRINEIKRDGQDQDFLTMTMTFSDQPGAPLLRSAETFARLAEAPDLMRDAEDHLVPTGHAWLVVGEALLESERAAIEYQTRVDGGLWYAARPARSDGLLLVEDPKLKLPGEHPIEVRARAIGEYQTLDPTPATVIALVDTVRPVVDAEMKLTVVEAVVRDVGPRPEQLALRGRFDDGPWFDIALSPMGAHQAATIPLAGMNAALLELVATDALGNKSRVERVAIGAAGLEAPLHPTSEAGGCACRGSAPAAGTSGTFFLFLGLLLAARRRVERR